MKKSIVFLISCLFFINTIHAQNGAIISAEELMYDFGTIVESDGPASHTFVVKNTGDAPLVITRVTVSCGCTTPEWSKIPIEPGMTGDVKITYNPKGRPGPFNKKVAIYSNGKKGAFSVNIKGNVVSKPISPPVTYGFHIGDLKLQSDELIFKSIRENETLGEKLVVRNEGKIPLNIQKGKVPNYLTVEIHPERLGTGETGEITFLFNAEAVKRKGHISTEVPIILSGTSKKGTTGLIRVDANIIDDFGKLSATERANSPVAQIAPTLLQFGETESKSGFFSMIPFIGGKVTETFTITNTGKSNLSIHSITCDSEIVDISGGKKEIKPGGSATYKITVRPKDIETNLETLITIVCNDPNGPVRLIKITAEK